MQVTHSPFEYPQQTRQWGETPKIQPNIQLNNPDIQNSLLKPYTKSLEHMKQYKQLQEIQAKLQKNISQGQIEYKTMLQLFEGITKRQKGEQVKFKKNRRRIPQDNYFRYPCTYCTKVFTTDSSMKRHIKLKHLDVGVDPPQSQPSKKTNGQVPDEMFNSSDDQSSKQEPSLSVSRQREQRQQSSI